MDSDGCANSDFSVAPRRVSILLAFAMEGSFLEPLEDTTKHDGRITLILLLCPSKLNYFYGRITSEQKLSSLKYLNERNQI